MKRILAFTVSIILVLTLCSCAKEYKENHNFYGGESLNAEMLSEIAESIFNEMQSSESADSQSGTVAVKEHNGIYYWTSGGSVYHKWSDCSHLKNSTNITSGNEQDALLAGKEKLCSTCAKRG